MTKRIQRDELDAAETVLGYFGFDRTLYGNKKNISKQKKEEQKKHKKGERDINIENVWKRVKLNSRSLEDVGKLKLFSYSYGSFLLRPFQWGVESRKNSPKYLLSLEDWFQNAINLLVQEQIPYHCREFITRTKADICYVDIIRHCT
jgi:hypothetical protein